MTIIFKDGGSMKCSVVVVYSDVLYVDDYRSVPIDEVEMIED